MVAFSILFGVSAHGLGEAFVAPTTALCSYRYRSGHILLAAHQETDGDVNVGRLKAFEYKNLARHRRLDELRTLNDTFNSNMTENERKEFHGLQSLGDPYDPKVFTREHKLFKTAHNRAFARLARHAHRANRNTDTEIQKDKPCAVFYLDGSDGGTTSILLDCGFDTKELYVANEWEDTIVALQSKPFHLLPTNCLLGTAKDVLRSPTTSKVPFAAAYFDGCGGMSRPIIDMTQALFAGSLPKQEFAIGFTLTDAEPDGIALIDRVQEVTRAILKEANRKGYDMHHVGDDPERFGMEDVKDWKRKHGSTCTTWVVCTSKNTNAM